MSETRKFRNALLVIGLVVAGTLNAQAPSSDISSPKKVTKTQSYEWWECPQGSQSMRLTPEDFNYGGMISGYFGVGTGGYRVCVTQKFIDQLAKEQGKQ